MNEYLIETITLENVVRHFSCKRVYRSGGKGRRKRVKWVKR